MATNWSGYPNGKIPLNLMVSVEGFYFEPVTAGCVRALLRDARAAGFTINITQGYRALGNPSDPWNTEPVTEWSAWNAYRQGKPLPGSSVVAVAAPPNESFHGDGTASDFTGTGWHPITALSKWLETHAILYGFIFDIPSESWHGHRSRAPQISLAATNAKPVTAPIPLSKEETMYLIQQESGKQPALYGEFTFNLIDATTMGAMITVFGQPVVVTDYVWTYLHDRVAENRALLAAK